MNEYIINKWKLIFLYRLSSKGIWNNRPPSTHGANCDSQVKSVKSIIEVQIHHEWINDELVAQLNSLWEVIEIF